MTHPGALFSMIGHFIKSAAAPRPSPELIAVREATKCMTDAATHLTAAAKEINDRSKQIGAIARKLQQGPKKPTTRKAAAK